MACIGAVAAKAQDARRERLARAVREKGRGKVKGGENDALCVICYSPPVDPVEVGDLCLCPCACLQSGRGLRLNPNRIFQLMCNPPLLCALTAPMRS